MKKNVCRLLAALLCLTLAPFAALAEEADIGLRFDLTFQMDDAAYPQEDQALLEGVAELLNMMSLSGTLAVSAPSFDMQFDLMLEDSEETRTSFRLYGLDTHYQLESSLLGDQGLMMNNLALLEFAMKAYFHLDMPLQYVALLISPYAHTSAFDWVRQEWNGVMHAQEGDRVIPRDAVLELAAYMSENAEMDRAFSFWVQALTLDAGYSDSIFEAMYGLGGRLSGRGRHHRDRSGWDGNLDHRWGDAVHSGNQQRGRSLVADAARQPGGLPGADGLQPRRREHHLEPAVHG